MRIKTLFIGFCALLSFYNSLAQSWQWGRTGYGDLNNSHIATDAWGNVYGSGCNSIIFSGPILFGSYTLTGILPQNIFIVKYAPDGSLLWARGTQNGNAVVGGLSADPFGNVYLFGYYTSSSIKIGTAVLTNPGGTEQFIVKYDAVGNVVWAKNMLHYNVMSMPTNAYTSGIQADRKGNVYFTSDFSGPSATIGSFTLANVDPTPMAIRSDVYMAKIDSTGNVLWAKSFGGLGDDVSCGMAVTKSGYLYVHGWFNSNSMAIGTTTISSASAGAGSTIYVARFDSLGNEVWARSPGGFWDQPVGIATDPSENVILSGTFKGTSLTFGAYTLSNPLRYYTGYLAKYDSSGNVRWAKAQVAKDHGSAAGVIGYSVATDPCGKIWMTGYVYDSVNIDGHLLSASGPLPLFITEFDNGGNYINTQTFSSGGFWNQIQFNGKGDLYLCGDYYLNTPMVFGPDTLKDTSFYSNFFIARYQELADSFYNRSDSAICIVGGSVLLQAPAGYSEYLWNDGSTDRSFLATSAGIYVLNATGSCPTGFLRDTFIVTFKADKDTSYHHTDTTMCAHSSISLTAPVGYTSYYWYNGNTNNINIVEDSGTYWVNAFVACDVLIDTIVVKSRTFTFTLSPDDTTCPGMSVPLFAKIDSRDAPFTFRWASSAGITDTGTVNTTFKTELPGYYKCYLTVQNNLGCVATDSVAYYVGSAPKIAVNPSSVVLSNDVAVQLEAEGVDKSNTLIYTWLPDDGSLNNPNINNPLAHPAATTMYTVIAMTPKGCRDTATAKVIVDYNMLCLPDAFTPNGDGLDDIFRLCSLHHEKLVDFTIFNRWGEIVYYNTSDPQQGWDGTYKGVQQDMGVYNYFIILEGSEGIDKIYKGNVTLIRQCFHSE